jgi:hypothetical protein
LVLYVLALVAVVLAITALVRGEGPLTAAAVLVMALAIVALHGGFLGK